MNAVPTPPLWVTSAGTMDAIAAVDPEVAAGAFVSDHAIALGGRPGAIAGRSWASCARFEADAASRVHTRPSRPRIVVIERGRLRKRKK